MGTRSKGPHGRSADTVTYSYAKPVKLSGYASSRSPSKLGRRIYRVANRKRFGWRAKQVRNRLRPAVVSA